ncbi:MAG: OadG family protein [Planctomycetota bacterium]|nr:OadG family protein [Planctomycetota bacterium]MDA1166567.1 OadG family protein [Planctomycetota bacterium]
MLLLTSEIDGITANTGLAIAITGMSIVFAALVLISLALVGLPKVLAVLNRYYPEKPDHSGSLPRAATGVSDQDIAAAAAFAMHIHRGGAM